MIVPNFRVQDLVNGKLERIIISLINALSYVGEQCVINAKDEGSYIDRTGNLRNSIGYIVLKNGIVQYKSRLLKESSALLYEELIPKYRQGIVLIVVAGMNYAAAVESRDYNVLSSAELLAEELVPKMLTELGFSRK